MFIAIVVSLCTMSQFVHKKESCGIQQLAWAHNSVANNYEGMDYAINKGLAYSYEAGASAAIVAGLSSGVVTPASLVCYAGAAALGL